MVNYKKLKPNKLYAVYWLDPITRLDEPVTGKFGRRISYGKIVVEKNFILVIHAEVIDDNDELEEEKDYTKLFKHLIYNIEEK